MNIKELQQYGLKRNQLAYLLILPAFVLVFSVLLIPILSTIWYSLHTIRLNMPHLGQPFIGIENYKNLFFDPRFWNGLRNTLYFTLGSALFTFLFGLPIALTLNKNLILSTVIRSIVLIPWSIPMVVCAQMWKWMYNGVFGVINEILLRFGLIKEYIQWLDSTDLAMYSVMIADAWKSTPFVAIVLLSGLKTIPESLYEAAKVDGANSFHSFWRITAPLLKPAIMVTLLFRTLDLIKSFDILYVMTYGGPINSTETLSLYSYKVVFPFVNFGYGTSISIMLTAISGILCAYYIKTLLGYSSPH